MGTAVAIRPRVATRPRGKRSSAFNAADSATRDLLEDLLTGDMKTTGAASVTASGARALAKNATWLPAGRTCPGRSSLCYGADHLQCYAAVLERARPGLARAADRRLAIWDEAIAANRGQDLAFELLKYVWDRQLSRGITRPTFRLHASGDFYSAAYATAWDIALRSVSFASLVRLSGSGLYKSINRDHGPIPLTTWTYTRSYGSVAGDIAARLLAAEGAPAPGFTLYLSSAESMVARTRNAVAGRYHRLPVAVMADDADHGADLLRRIRATDARPDAGIGVTRRTWVCPVDSGRMGHVVESRGETVGACYKCRACLPVSGIDSAPDIIFPIH